MQLNLKNARRVDRELESHITRLGMQLSQSNNPVISGYVTFADQILRHQAAIESTFETIVMLNTLRHSIRRDIEKANEESGINGFMTLSVSLKAIIQAGEHFNGETSDNQIAEKQLANMVSQGSPNAQLRLTNIAHPAWVKKVKEEQTFAKANLFRLTEQIATLNATVKISLTDDEVAKLEALNIILA